MSFRYLKQVNQKTIFTFGLLSVSFLLLPFLVHAIMYQPGETLNPLCAPTDANCGVATTTPSSAGHLIPNTANLYDLGSSDKSWRSLYLSSSTLYLGIVPVSVANGALVVGGNEVITTAMTSGTVNLSVATSTYAQSASTSTVAEVSLSLSGFNQSNYLTLAEWNATTTDALAEGAVNKYYTNARFDNRFTLKTTNDLIEGGNLYFTNARFDTRLADKSSDNLAEGISNLYFTNTRARNALSVSSTGGLSYSTSTGAFSLAMGNLTAPSNPEVTITGGIGAVIGSGLTFVIPEANATTRGLISTTTQTIAGDKTFSGALTVSNVSNPNAFTVTADGSIGIGTVPDATKQLHIKFDADKGALFDGRTNPRTVTVGVVRFEHTAGAEGTKPVFYDIDAAGYANTHATEVTYKTGAMTGEANVHDIIIDGTGATGGKIHGLQVDVINPSGLSKIIGLGTDPHTDPIEQHTGTYTSVPQSWYYNLSTYTDITTGTNTVFNVNNSYVYVGADTAFTTFQVTLAVVASVSITPGFEFWNGTTSLWTAFSPTDGTNGFRNSGTISVTAPNWATTTVNGVSKFYVRIKRTKSSVPTPPQISLIQTNSAITYYWDKTGKIKINTIETTGSVGIGMADPSVALDVNGNIEYTGTITDVSDATLKENMVSLDMSLEKLLKLKAISFNMIGDDTKELGFTAQNVQEYFPELVSVIDPEPGILGLNYVGLIAPVIQAIQEIASLGDTFKQSLVAWFSNTGNGIADFFAKKIHTEQICLKKSDGNEYCINGDELETIINQKLSTSLSMSDVDNDAKEDVVLSESQPQESMTEFSLAETAVASTTEVVNIESIQLENKEPLTEQVDETVNEIESQEPAMEELNQTSS